MPSFLPTYCTSNTAFDPPSWVPLVVAASVGVIIIVFVGIQIYTLESSEIDQGSKHWIYFLNDNGSLKRDARSLFGEIYAWVMYIKVLSCLNHFKLWYLYQAGSAIVTTYSALQSVLSSSTSSSVCTMNQYVSYFILASNAIAQLSALMFLLKTFISKAAFGNYDSSFWGLKTVIISQYRLHDTIFESARFMTNVTQIYALHSLESVSAWRITWSYIQVLLSLSSLRIFTAGLDPMAAVAENQFQKENFIPFRTPWTGRTCNSPDAKMDVRIKTRTSVSTFALSNATLLGFVKSAQPELFVENELGMYLLG